MTESELKAARRKFLDDTCGHFNKNNRGVKDGRYSFEAGSAIGRHLPIELAKKMDKLDNPSLCLTIVFDLLPEDLKELGHNFIASIEILHDTSYYWTPKGLSRSGKARRDEMIEFYC